MAWELTSPIPVGGLDSTPYDKLKITRFSQDSVHGGMDVQLEYGYEVTEGGVTRWVTGLQPRDKATYVQIVGQQYAEFVASAEPQQGEKTYAAVKRGLYEWLYAHSYIPAGTVV